VPKGFYKRKKPAWNKGKHFIFRKDDILESSERHRFEHYQWSQTIKKRDNFTCRHCGKLNLKDHDCHAHHIMEWDKFPELRLDLNNGITLCRSCHRKEHFKRLGGGYGNQYAKGSVRTEEWKQKQSLAQKNRPWSPARRMAHELRYAQ
jgi:5-methylcytosine-specific restriction endonuclease McrA